MRKPLIIANWKMNKILFEAEAFARDFVAQMKEEQEVLVVICPPYTALYTVGRILDRSNVMLGAQDVFWAEEGAYTGRISARMLSDAGVTYVIVGNSECRGRFGMADSSSSEELMSSFSDNDAVVSAKLKAALRWGLRPVLCVGETLAERDAGKTDDVILAQLEAALHGIDEVQIDDVSVAYEPVWAIGTGRVYESREADRICGLIRGFIEERFTQRHADSTHILYGGSVKPDNIADIMLEPHIDGALVGGASLDAESFRKIVHFRYLQNF